MDAEAIVDDLKRQVQELRAGGAEPKALELGDGAYEVLRGRAGRGFASVNLLEDDAPGTAWFGPGGPPEQRSAIARWLPVRRAGPGDCARVIANP